MAAAARAAVAHATAVPGGRPTVTDRVTSAATPRAVPSWAPVFSNPVALPLGIIAFSLAEDDPLLHVVLARRLPLVVVDQPGPEHHFAALGTADTPRLGINDRIAVVGVAEHPPSWG